MADDARLLSLVSGYAEWMRRRQRPPALDTVRLLLEHRADYLDDQLTRWTGHDVADALVGLFQRGMMASADEAEEIVAAMRSLLEYLGESGQLQPEGERLDRLLVALDEIGEELAWALEDDTDDDREVGLELDLEFDPGGRLDLPADFSPGPVRLARRRSWPPRPGPLRRW